MKISKKEFDAMRARRSKADINLIFTWLRDDGEIKVVDEALFAPAVTPSRATRISRASSSPSRTET